MQDIVVGKKVIRVEVAQGPRSDPALQLNETYLDENGVRKYGMKNIRIGINSALEVLQAAIEELNSAAGTTFKIISE